MKPPEVDEPREVNCSPFWALYMPSFRHIMSQVRSGPLQKATRAGMPVKQAGAVGVILVMGVLDKRMSWFLDVLGGTSYLGIKASINAALEDRAIEEILLVIDSPGGSVNGLAETGELIREARAKKQVTALIDGLGASAAYWLASQATEVVAERTSLVGSIGTITYLYDMSKMYEEAGVKPVVVSTGEFKGTGIPGTKVTDKQKAELQGIVDFYGDDFRDAVVKGRRLDPKAVAKLATGEVWPAPAALEHRLIDRMGTFEEVLTSLGAAVSRRARTRSAQARAVALGILRPGR